jgi:predicted neuraminidase
MARALALILAFWATAAAAAPGFLRADLPVPPVAENHGAAIAQLPSGAFLACWYSGLHEADHSVRIVCSRGDGAVWSQPWTAVAPGERAIGAAAPNKTLGNVTLTVTPDGRIWMIYGVVQSRVVPLLGNICRNWFCGRIDARVSADEGRSWAPAHRLIDIGGALPRAELKPMGRDWLAPFYEENQQRAMIVKLSLTGAAPTLHALWRLHGVKLIQPALAQRRDGRFDVFFRDQARRGVWSAVFDPRTGAWTGLTLTNLPNPGAAVDVFPDDAGRYVVIYNPSPTSRDTLALARSADGRHFTTGCAISQPRDGAAAYPSVIRGRDGAWRVVYSALPSRRVVFVRFDSAWLDNCFANKG